MCGLNTIQDHQSHGHPQLPVFYSFSITPRSCSAIHACQLVKLLAFFYLHYAMRALNSLVLLSSYVQEISSIFFFIFVLFVPFSLIFFHCWRNVQSMGCSTLFRSSFCGFKTALHLWGIIPAFTAILKIRDYKTVEFSLLLTIFSPKLIFWNIFFGILMCLWMSQHFLH